MDIDKAWKFDRGHWEIIDHLMWAYHDHENLDSPEDMFYLAGYNANSSLTLGRWGLAFHVDVHLPYPRPFYKDIPVAKPGYPYFISIFLVVEYVPIYVVDQSFRCQASLCHASDGQSSRSQSLQS